VAKKSDISEVPPPFFLLPVGQNKER